MLTLNFYFSLCVLVTVILCVTLVLSRKYCLGDNWIRVQGQGEGKKLGLKGGERGNEEI